LQEIWDYVAAPAEWLGFEGALAEALAQPLGPPNPSTFWFDRL
jgi:hypothetical protein